MYSVIKFFDAAKIVTSSDEMCGQSVDVPTLSGNHAGTQSLPVCGSERDRRSLHSDCVSLRPGLSSRGLEALEPRHFPGRPHRLADEQE